MATLLALKSAMEAKFNELESEYDLNTELSEEEQGLVSVAIDKVNETWNGNLPQRPAS